MGEHHRFVRYGGLLLVAPFALRLFQLDKRPSLEVGVMGLIFIFSFSSSLSLEALDPPIGQILYFHSPSHFFWIFRARLRSHFLGWVANPADLFLGVCAFRGIDFDHDVIVA